MDDTILPSMAFAVAGKHVSGRAPSAAKEKLASPTSASKLPESKLSPLSVSEPSSSRSSASRSSASRSGSSWSLSGRNQIRALLYLLLCWSIGTLIWESLVWGADDRSFSHRLREQETSTALNSSNIPEFYRLEKNRRVRALLVQAIQTEEAIRAMRKSTASWKPLPNQIEIDPNAIAVDPIMDSMLIAKAERCDAYRRLDDAGQHLMLSDRTSDRLLWDDAVGSSLPGLVRLIQSQFEIGNLVATDTVAAIRDRPANETSSPTRRAIQVKTVGFRSPRKTREAGRVEGKPPSTMNVATTPNDDSNHQPKILHGRTRILEVDAYLLD